jgi:flagellar M-ring protein FliF
LRRRAERLLEARVGPGNAIVEVSVETITQSELVRERILDPDSRVLISSDTEERSAAANDTRPGPVTVASNLPDGDAEGAGAQSSSDDTEVRERSNYDVSETTREATRGPGGIERITVAVLVNSVRASAVVGDDSQASAEGDLDALQALVVSAVGIDESRGDVVTIRSLPFTDPPISDAPESGIAAQLAASLNPMQLVQLFTLAAVTIVLGLFVVRPMLVRRPFPPAVAAGAGTAALPPPAAPRETPAVLASSAPRRLTDPSQSLVRTVGDKRSEAADVLRNWISQEDQAR